MGKQLHKYLSKEFIKMVNRYVKMCPKLVVTREMQIKTTIRRYHFTPARWLLLKGEEMTSVGKDMEKWETICIVDGSIIWNSHCRKQYGGSLRIKNITTI